MLKKILFYALFCALAPLSLLLAGQCGKCKKNLPSSYQFCPFDGAKIWRACPSCKKGMNPQWSFCPFDGTHLTKQGKKTATPSLPPPGPYKPKKHTPSTKPVKKKTETKIRETVLAKKLPSPFAESVEDLPPLDLVRKFMTSLRENNPKIATLLVDWDAYYFIYLQKFTKEKEGPSTQGWDQKRDAFKAKILSRFFSVENRKIIRHLRNKHYLLKMGNHKMQVIVSASIGSKYLKNVFTLKKSDNRFKIVFIGN